MSDPKYNLLAEDLDKQGVRIEVSKICSSSNILRHRRGDMEIREHDSASFSSPAQRVMCMNA